MFVKEPVVIQALFFDIDIIERVKLFIRQLIQTIKR